MTANPTIVLAAQMLEIANTGCLKIHICHWEGQIKARPSNHTCEVHPIFAIYTNEEILKGLTAEQWCALGEKIGEFFRSKS